MMSLRGLLRIQPQLRFPLIKPIQKSPSLVTLTAPQRLLSTSPILLWNKNEEKHRRKIQNVEASEERLQDVVSLDALKAVEVPEENITEEMAQEIFSIYPDETTSDKLFNGIPFKDLPSVQILLHKNNTRLFARLEKKGVKIWRLTDVTGVEGTLTGNISGTTAPPTTGLSTPRREPTWLARLPDLAWDRSSEVNLPLSLSRSMMVISRAWYPDHPSQTEWFQCCPGQRSEGDCSSRYRDSGHSRCDSC